MTPILSVEQVNDGIVIGFEDGRICHFPAALLMELVGERGRQVYLSEGCVSPQMSTSGSGSQATILH